MWLDITRPLEPGMAVYPGDAPFSLQTEIISSIYRLSEMRMSLHCGTHVDAPAHFYPLAKTSEMLDMESMNGRVQVLELEAALSGWLCCERVLLKAPRGISVAEAESLRWQGLRLIGTDRMSLSADDCEQAVHLCLLGADIVLLENLRLDGIPNGFYELRCLPLLIPGAEAAPARAMLRPWRDD